MKERKIVKYIFITINKDPFEFHNIVNSNIKEGFVPFGSLCRDGDTLTQAMVKYEDVEWQK